MSALTVEATLIHPEHRERVDARVSWSGDIYGARLAVVWS
jgi:hypothetical protein